ncbi:LOW QUALITY PROTEIN: tripartite motif-containing protein 16-like [Acanthochromis polyacanthus]|uniref:LOW QUALITY PROTEIN: tripartite motif-containing protein 16-like n=1 Tax=Acanthochromis polyacanthus TaxID=80966 RepID=UPI0022343E4A|nr:LOW QUALITY PROTEIN: tripartite motif-containing protein 16-like [Acanthochromis polyacanthus]
MLFGRKLAQEKNLIVLLLLAFNNSHFCSGDRFTGSCNPSQIFKLAESLRGEMVQQGIQMDQNKLSCSICLDLLKDPVTIPCGHIYCLDCIKNCWDRPHLEQVYSCPQCRHMFRLRPDLKKNAVLADLIEELMKTRLQSAAADLCHAGPGDVSWDFCTGRKLKAVKSCLQCLVSYCEQHLQPHYQSPAFEKHRLVDLSKKLQENICSGHNEVVKIFCRTDQQCVCYLCSVDKHRGHNTVSAAAEKNEKQRVVGLNQVQIHQRIQDREKDVRMLQQQVKAINQSADKAVTNSEEIQGLIRRIEKRNSDVKQQIRSKQTDEVRKVRELQEKLKQELVELKMRSSELEQLSQTEDHIQFLQLFSCHISVKPQTHPTSLVFTVCSTLMCTVDVSKTRDKLQDILKEDWTKTSARPEEVSGFKIQSQRAEFSSDRLKTLSQSLQELSNLRTELRNAMAVAPWPTLSPAEPKTRAEFLQYSRHLTLDPNTAHTQLVLSDGNRKAAVTRQIQVYGHHPDRFMEKQQVLSKESLTGRCYWEVEQRPAIVSVAVTYKGISRTGPESAFAYNKKSWALENSNIFVHNRILTLIRGSPSSRIGVYLDHSAGILSFYRVSDTMTLLHRVQTAFAQPLYAGLGINGVGSGKLCQLIYTDVIKEAKSENLFV